MLCKFNNFIPYKKVKTEVCSLINKDNKKLQFLFKKYEFNEFKNNLSINNRTFLSKINDKYDKLNKEQIEILIKNNIFYVHNDVGKYISKIISYIIIDLLTHSIKNTVNFKLRYINEYSLLYNIEQCDSYVFISELQCFIELLNRFEEVEFKNNDEFQYIGNITKFSLDRKVCLLCDAICKEKNKELNINRQFRQSYKSFLCKLIMEFIMLIVEHILNLQKIIFPNKKTIKENIIKSIMYFLFGNIKILELNL